jgi:hypothetical protein
MKIWRSYGSGHSARLSVVGEFTTVDDAALIRQAVEDFVNGQWAEKYPDVSGFIDDWRERLPGVDGLGPNQSEFDMGLDDSCDVERSGTRVAVSGIRTNEVGGIIKIMLLKDPTEVKVTGRTGP